MAAPSMTEFKIMGALSQQIKSVKEIVEQSGVPGRNARAMLIRLRDAGRIENPFRGQYKLKG